MPESPQSKREPAQTIPTLEKLNTESESSLKKLLSEDPLQAEDSNDTRSLIKGVKSQWKNYMETSSQLTEKLIKIGSLEEAQNLRDGRSEMRLEVRHFIGIANAVLKNLSEDLESNIDTRSVVSEPRGCVDDAQLSNLLDPSETNRVSSGISTASVAVSAIETESAQPISSRNAHFADTFGLNIFSNPLSEPNRSWFPPSFQSSRGSRNQFSSVPTISTQTISHAAPFSLPSRSVCEATSLPAWKYGNLGPSGYGGGAGELRQDFANFPRAENFRIDATAQHLLKQELFKPSSTPFQGDPQSFHSWMMLLENRMSGLHLSSLDEINILINNTGGEPNNTIRDYLAAGAANPEITLENIWKYLRREYGSSVKVCQAIQAKLNDISIVRPPNVKSKLKDLLHVCRLIESNMVSNQELLVYNLSVGQRKVWQKLPDYLQRKWRSRGHGFGLENMGAVPPFTNLVDFIQVSLDEISDPNYELQLPVREFKKTLVSSTASAKESIMCIYHSKPGHSLINCRNFGKLPYAKKHEFAAEKKLCYKCLGKHFARECDSKSKCSKCSGNHVTAMHVEKRPDAVVRRNSDSETPTSSANTDERNALCSVVCGSPHNTLSCSKTVLCEVYHESQPNKTMKLYVIIDDMSNASYISEKVLDQLNLTGVETRYMLTTMESLKSEHTGTVVSGLWIRGVSKDKYYSLPNLTSSAFIPGSIYEVGTPKMVESIPHLSRYAGKFSELDVGCEPLMLIGRDSGDLIKSTYHGAHAPFVCETLLGYALVGTPCSNNKCKTKIRNVENFIHEHYCSRTIFYPASSDVDTLFSENVDDDAPGESVEDRRFLDFVETNMNVNDSGCITVGLPFKSEDTVLPNNKLSVYHRTKNTLRKLKSDEGKLQHCVKIMSKNLAAGHIEKVPENEQVPLNPGKAWWLPVFPVTHPKKGKHRLVFDGSALYGGTSLNKVLLQGPDQNNRLRGVLMRFRMGEVAFGADIESMFYNFYLPVEDRDYLRMFWFNNNDPSQEIVQFRGCVHLFGNRSSPAVAHAGLQYATKHPDAQTCGDAVKFISENIYVDDLLAACRTTEQAVAVLKEIKTIFGRYKINLCKIISNRTEVTNRFPECDRASTRSELDIGDSSIHRALGLAWHIQSDSFIIKVELVFKPLTRRGILSVTNSIYDPLGIVGPVVLRSKIIQREALKVNRGEQPYDWDEPLPDHFVGIWKNWLDSLSTLSCIALPRSYIPNSFGEVARHELHVFTDASESAIGAVVYLKLLNYRSDIHVSYVISASKLVPKACISIPRSELCAALLGSKLCREVQKELRFPIEKTVMYSDSKVVLAYLCNTEKRFSRYVSHRVSAILKITKLNQWQYINTSVNPADIACRPQTPESLAQSVWVSGPDFLWRMDSVLADSRPDPPLELPETLPEKTMLKSNREQKSVLHDLFRRVSKFVGAVRVMGAVLRFCNRMLLKTRGSQLSVAADDSFAASTSLVLLFCQDESYSELLQCLRSGNRGTSNVERILTSLDPFIDGAGVIRVGGRLRESGLSYGTKYPVLLHPEHPLSAMIVRHYHGQVRHQGRHMTLGAVRTAGYFIERGSKFIRKIISDCIICKKLRAKPEEQIMAPLPACRTDETAVFHNSGVDVFGPYLISDGRYTRRHSGSRKIWGLLITCMSSRAIHVEPLSGLDTSSLANALRRFIAIRGTCSNLYSDRSRH